MVKLEYFMPTNEALKINEQLNQLVMAIKELQDIHKDSLGVGPEQPIAKFMKEHTEDHNRFDNILEE